MAADHTIENISPSEWLRRAVLEDRRVFPSKAASQDQSRTATGIKRLSTEIYEGLEDDPEILIASLGTEGAPDAIAPRADFPDARSLERYVRSVMKLSGPARERGEIREDSVFPILRALLLAGGGDATKTTKRFNIGNRWIETSDIAAWGPDLVKRPVEFKNWMRFLETLSEEDIYALDRRGERPIWSAPGFWPEWVDAARARNRDVVALPDRMKLVPADGVEGLRRSRFSSVPVCAPDELTFDGPANVVIAQGIAEEILGYVPDIELADIGTEPSARSRKSSSVQREVKRIVRDGRRARLVEAALRTGAPTQSAAAKEIGVSSAKLSKAITEEETWLGVSLRLEAWLHGGARSGSGPKAGRAA